MIISLINHSKTVTDAELQRVARAINRQISEDFEPYWSFGATLRLEGPVGSRPHVNHPSDMRGDAVLYLVEGSSAIKATGFHVSNFADIPFGIVLLEMCRQMKEHWSITLSHEALELVGDPMANLFVQGPHPLDRRRKVLHMFEMCDAVQNENYLIDEVAVSNFVLPSYFSPGEAEGRRNDFLGTQYNGETLLSFGINPGGYLNILDPKTGKWSQPERPDDAVAESRRQIKAGTRAGRGYRRMHPQTKD